MGRSETKIPELDSRGLRSFAFVTAGMLVAMFGLLLPWVFGFEIPSWPFVGAAIFAVLGAVWPTSLKYVYKVWMRFGLLLNKVTAPLILSIVYFLVIVPIGLCRRMFAADPMSRKFDDTKSYRKPSNSAISKNLERPF